MLLDTASKAAGIALALPTMAAGPALAQDGT